MEVGVPTKNVGIVQPRRIMNNYKKEVGAPTKTSERIGYIYILVNKDHHYYIGSTDNLNRRLKQHSAGHTQTTRNLGRWKLVLSQTTPSLLIARLIERKLKKMKRKDYIEKIIRDGYIKVQA